MPTISPTLDPTRRQLHSRAFPDPAEAFPVRWFREFTRIPAYASGVTSAADSPPGSQSRELPVDSRVSGNLRSSPQRPDLRSLPPPPLPFLQTEGSRSSARLSRGCRGPRYSKHDLDGSRRVSTVTQADRVVANRQPVTPPPDAVPRSAQGPFPAHPSRTTRHKRCVRPRRGRGKGTRSRRPRRRPASYPCDG